MKWGLLGCGDMAGKATATSIQRADGCELVAVYGRRNEKASAFARRFGVPRSYDDLDEFIRDPEIEAVFVSTPVSLHCGHTLACLRHEKHVLCEKPMALTVAECEQMIRESRRQGRALSIAYYRRGYPQSRWIKDCLESDALGRPFWFHFQYATSYDPQPGARGSWRLSPEVSGGGVLPDVGSHRIDLALYIGGPVSAVKSLADTFSRGWDVDDTASLLLQFERGAHGLVQVSFCCTEKLDRLAVHCTEGHLIAEPFEKGRITLIRKGETLTHEVPPLPRDECQRPMVENFAQHVEYGVPLLGSMEDGRRTDSIMEGAYSQLDKGSEHRPIVP